MSNSVKQNNIPILSRRRLAVSDIIGMISATMANTRKQYTITQAAISLGMSRETVIRILDRGEFPNSFKTSDNGHWRIPSTDLTQYTNRRKMQPA